MELTEAGLLVERTEVVAALYDDHADWEAAKSAWHEQRLSGRSSRHSAQKIFRVIRTRLQGAGDRLPSVSALVELLAACHDPRSKAQIIYLYLVEADALVKHTVQALLRRRNAAPLNLSPESLSSLLTDPKIDS